jgi:DNA-directed RNA polymerase specialized sigma24 family protein
VSSLNIVLNTYPPPVALSSKPQEAPAAGAASINWGALVAQIHANDDTAMEQLYKLFSRGVRHLFLRQLGPEDLDERVRDTFQLVVKAIQRGELEEPEPLWGLVRTVAQRQVAGYINEVARQRCPEGEAGGAGPCMGDRKANLEWKAWEYQRAELVKSVLLRLSDRDQEILRRLYQMGQTDEQIQAEMSLTETQFRVLKPRAKQHFGKHWKKRSCKKHEFTSGPCQAVPLRTGARKG